MHATRTTLTRIWLLALLVLCASAAFAEAGRARLRIPGEVPLDIEAAAIDIAAGREVRATGEVVITRGADVLRAQSAVYDLRTQEVRARDGVSLTQPGRQLNAEQLRYNATTGDAAAVGIEAALAASQEDVTYYLEGDSFTGSYPDRIQIYEGTLSTCNAERRHWAVHAREILLEPGQRVLARNVSLILFGTRLLTIPSLDIGLGRGTSAAPRIVFGSRDTLGLRSDFRVGLTQNISAPAYAVLSARYLFRGGIGVERFGVVPAGLRLGIKEDATSRIVSGLTVSTFPVATLFLPEEIGPKGALQIGLSKTPDHEGYLKGDITREPWEPHRKVRVLGMAGAGRFIEYPTRTSANRADLIGAVEARPFRLASSLDLTASFAGRVSYYSGGDRYGVVTPGASLDWRPSRRDRLRLDYRHHIVEGNTPFFFDRIDTPRVLSLGWDRRTSREAFRVAVGLDTQTSDLYSWQLAYSRRLHCLQPGLSLRREGEDFTVGLILEIPGLGGSTTP